MLPDIKMSQPPTKLFYNFQQGTYFIEVYWNIYSDGLVMKTKKDSNRGFLDYDKDIRPIIKKDCLEMFWKSKFYNLMKSSHQFRTNIMSLK